MLRHVAILSIVLQLAASAPRAQSAPGPDVRIDRKTVWVKSREALQTACGKTDPVRACTQVTAALIAGPCVERADGWSLRAPAIRVSAVMIVVASRQPFVDGAISHENVHLADFRASFDAYLLALGARSFASGDECAAAAGEEEAGFGALMKVFEIASNRNLHPDRPPGAAVR